MHNKYLINLEPLSKKQLDFHNYCLENIEIIFKFSIPDLAKKYGVGVSFIYLFIKRLGLHNFKEYIYFLGTLKKNKKILGGDMDVIYNVVNASNAVNNELFDKQKDKIYNLVLDIKNSQNTFGMGLGYSKLAIRDLFGLLDKWNRSFKIISDEREDEMGELNKIEGIDLLIIYSIRGVNKKLINWVSKIKTNDNLKNLKIYLVTSNVKSKLVKLVSEVIELDNVMKRVDDINSYLLISPLNTFVYLNNYIKSIFYVFNKTKTNRTKEWVDEIQSWNDEEIINQS